MSRSFVLTGRWWALLIAAAALLPGRLGAQTSTGSIRGHVADSSSVPIAGAEVVARDLATNTQRAATTDGRGFYSLSGLKPAQYQLTVRHIGHSPVQRQLQVQVGQVLTLDFLLAPTTVQLEELVTTVAPVTELRTTENATNVTQEQIQNLPTSSRNFLDLAQLAPGVRVTPDRINGTGKTFASGALPADNINVFIDGQSLKNDITIGGVVGAGREPGQSLSPERRSGVPYRHQQLQGRIPEGLECHHHGGYQVRGQRVDRQLLHRVPEQGARGARHLPDQGQERHPADHAVRRAGLQSRAHGRERRRAGGT